jgi:hypothetical protein
METRYERPEVQATYSADELAEEAALCLPLYEPATTDA